MYHITLTTFKNERENSYGIKFSSDDYEMISKMFMTLASSERPILGEKVELCLCYSNSDVSNEVTFMEKITIENLKE